MLHDILIPAPLVMQITGIMTPESLLVRNPG